MNANLPFINTHHHNLWHRANRLPTRFLIISLVLAIRASSIFAQGVISDPGFESGTFVTGGTGGWDSLSGSPVFSQDYARTGTWSVKSSLGIGPSICLVHQWVTVQPGSQYQLTGWGLTSARLATTAEGYITFSFGDANHVHIVQGYRSANITSGSLLNTWLSLSATAAAPANAAYADIVAGVASPVQTFGNNSVYFDDVNIIAVPEPSTLGIIATGLLAWRVVRNSKSPPAPVYFRP
jgi:hypothetical protein